jgi:hypothetical protein
MTGYFGSKAALGLYQNIIAMMAPHDTYIESHLGGGAVMRNKPPARNNIAIDIDPEPLEAFDCGYHVQKVNDCAHRYLREYDYAGSELIYCDPPYRFYRAACVKWIPRLIYKKTLICLSSGRILTFPRRSKSAGAQLVDGDYRPQADMPRG